MILSEYILGVASLPEMVIWISILSITLFSLAWATAVRINNYSIVDALWSLSFGLFALFVILFGPGDQTRKLLIGGMFFIWSVRLGGYLTIRIFSHLDQEDRRYQKLREDYGDRVRFRFFLFFMMQAVSVVLLLAPLFVAATNPSPGITLLEWIGGAVWFIGLIGESVSDSQMSAFRADPQNKGKVCERGLWYYSRHPNYFFESVIWLGYGIFAVSSPMGWTTLFAPALIWFLLLKVTGIPYAEETSLRTRGDLYRDYQRRTSAFVPWFKRK